jgi:hypothetical protein
MPLTNITTAIIGMTISTSTDLQSTAASAVDESNHRKMNQSRMLEQMLHLSSPPPPPPPITSVYVKTHPTTDRRSLTVYAGDTYEDSDDDSMSSCSMEVMSVNAPYDYYSSGGGESSFLRHSKRSGGFEDDEEKNTTDSTGSFDDHVCVMSDKDDVEESRQPGARRNSQRRPQPQQMARILACSSPEITALCKSSFQLPTRANDDSHRSRFQRQVVSDMMSIGSCSDDAPRGASSSQPPDVLMESMCTVSKSQWLPPLCPPPILQEEQTYSDAPLSPVRTVHSIPSRSIPPTWTDAWLRDGKDANVLETSTDLVPSSSSETESPRAAFRPSSYPRFHCNDNCFGMTSRSVPYQHRSSTTRLTLNSLISSGNAILQPEGKNGNDGTDDKVALSGSNLTKVSLHRRLSNDKLPTWTDIVIASNTTTASTTGSNSTNHTHDGLTGPMMQPGEHYRRKDMDPWKDFSTESIHQLEKLVLHKNWTVVSDETAMNNVI